MKKIIVIMLLVPMILTAQAADKKEDSTKKSGSSTEKDFPTQMIDSDEFAIRHVSFNKKVDPAGKGELLQVDFQLENEVDVALDLYIHIIVTHEELIWAYDSFGEKKIIPKKIDTRYFSSLPDDRSLFEYEIDGKKTIVKYPKNIKAGVNTATGKPYHLSDYMAFRYEFLCHYRRKYEFFNKATILIFDDSEKLLFRQSYSLDKYRR